MTQFETKVTNSATDTVVIIGSNKVDKFILMNAFLEFVTIALYNEMIAKSHFQQQSHNKHNKSCTFDVGYFRFDCIMPLK